MSSGLLINSQDMRSAAPSSSLVGTMGEELAAEYLEESGYRIIMANFKVPVGRNSMGAQVTGEIDIIALDGDVLCFIEVKTKRSDDFASPSMAVTARKQRQIIRTAKVYRRIFGVTEMEHRYDVVSIVLRHFGSPEIELLKGFWTEEKFRKRRWVSETW